MRKRIIGVLLGLVVQLGCTSLAPAVSRLETTHILVADGIELATDIYHPAKGPAPVILIRTPYGRDAFDFMGKALAPHGYAVVVQDVRGKYDSGGEHVPFRHERADGQGTLEWIARQSWCNGRIGIWGISYSAYAGLVLADLEASHLQSILAISGWLDARDIIQPGGAMHLMLDLPWMLTQQGRRPRGLGEFDTNSLLKHTPLNEAMRAAGISNSAWEDPAWMDTMAEVRPLGKVRRPVLHVTGWSDMVYRASLKAWERLSARGGGKQKLIIGPWFHDQMMMGAWEVGDANFGEASGFGMDELVALTLKWFDATLMKKNKEFLKEADVTYFLMEQNVWHQGTEWPPAEDASIDMQRWYLDSGGNAGTSSGDGVLSTTPPAGAAADHFVYDPHDPVPTLGGANFHFFPEKLGVRDQREIERRKDVLVFTSAPLAQEIHLTGRLEAHLHVATSGKDTDFTAKLVVVRPDGYARIVEEGIARASAQLTQVPPPGQPFSVTVDLGQTAISVPSGHRLRMEISSSNFPKYDRNPNTGENPFTARELVPAEQTIFHDAVRSSYVALPVRRQALIASAKGRQPLVQPLETRDSETVKVAGDDAPALLAEGRSELDNGKADRAIAIFTRLAELRPDSTDSHFWLGRAYLAKLQNASMFKKLGLSKHVRAAYLKAIELDQENVEARSSLASFYFNAPGIAGGSDEKGMQQVEEIRKRRPRDAHVLLAGLYAGRKDASRAKQEYRAVIALDPDDADAYYALGLVCQGEEDWEGAYEAFENGVRAAADARSLYQVGRTGAFSGQRLERARVALEQYIAQAPDSPTLPSVAHARWRLGMIFERSGRRDLARAQYEGAMLLDPDLEQVKEALEVLERTDRAATGKP